MEKYMEESGLFDNIKTKIYPWVKERLEDRTALNGRYISPDDTPIISFVDSLMIVFVIKRGEEEYEILKDEMLPPGTDMEELYHTACQNLARDVEFVFSNTMYGGFGVIADGIHEASALCFKHIWEVCTEKLQDDVVIMAPSKDLLLFVPEKDKKALEQMIAFGEEGFRRSQDKVSRKLLHYSRERKELTAYEKN